MNLIGKLTLLISCKYKIWKIKKKKRKKKKLKIKHNIQKYQWASRNKVEYFEKDLVRSRYGVMRTTHENSFGKSESSSLISPPTQLGSTAKSESWLIMLKIYFWTIC